MTPTQAQIEAAARAMMYAQMECGGTPSMTNGAAQYIAKAALTAATEVGPVTCLDIEMATRSAVSVTIERCAQVAYDWLRTHGWLAEAGDCVAAIRALKDQL